MCCTWGIIKDQTMKTLLLTLKRIKWLQKDTTKLHNIFYFISLLAFMEWVHCWYRTAPTLFPSFGLFMFTGYPIIRRNGTLFIFVYFQSFSFITPFYLWLPFCRMVSVTCLGVITYKKSDRYIVRLLFTFK